MFSIVRSSEDIKDDRVSFKPEMCHQIFGEGLAHLVLILQATVSDFMHYFVNCLLIETMSSVNLSSNFLNFNLFSETIFGYQDLSIKIYFSAGALKPYVQITHKKKISKASTDGVEVGNKA